MWEGYRGMTSSASRFVCWCGWGGRVGEREGRREGRMA